MIKVYTRPDLSKFDIFDEVHTFEGSERYTFSFEVGEMGELTIYRFDHEAEEAPPVAVFARGFWLGVRYV